jgi:hypothetical protein
VTRDERISQWLAACEREDRAHRLLGWAGTVLVIMFIIMMTSMSITFG